MMGNREIRIENMLEISESNMYCIVRLTTRCQKMQPLPNKL